MFIKITTNAVVFDVNNPERKFKRNQVLKVHDPARAKAMLSKGLGIEIEEAKDYTELDKKEVKKKTKKEAKTPPKK